MRLLEPLFILLSSAIIMVACSPPRNIIILAGQSNMAGRGGVTTDGTTGVKSWDGVVPPESQPNPSVLRLAGNLTWVIAAEPLHKDIDVRRINGVGPGMAFANSILSDLSDVGLVPCAIGGSKILEWQKGEFYYEQMIARAEAALRNGGVLRAMLWFQGESDTTNENDAVSYGGRLENFFISCRSELQSPDLPIFQVALASGEGRYVETVREAQLAVSFPNVYCVDAMGLELESDRLHLDTASQVKLGKMLAGSFIQFLKASDLSGTNKETTRVWHIMLVIAGVFSFLP